MKCAPVEAAQCSSSVFMIDATEHHTKALIIPHMSTLSVGASPVSTDIQDQHRKMSRCTSDINTFDASPAYEKCRL